MEDHTLEGTWEEILQHAAELTGHRVRVTVFDEEEKPSPSLAEAMKDRLGRLSFDVPVDLPEKSGELLTDLLSEPHQKSSV